ncbi:4-phosphopantetheinyl transferase family protein [bacterium]|nr:4-phosphopantetheinyl transferase family protein [bacterium]
MLSCAKTLPGCPIVLVREEDAAAALEAAFSQEERAQAAAFPTEKRRREWSLGRLAAKAAVVRALEEKGEVVRESEIRVDSGAFGTPRAYLVRAGACSSLELGLSLSHGHGTGAAWATASGLPGVDVELVRERPEGTFRFYLDERERAPVLALAGAARDHAAVVLWSLKEAAWKTLCPGRGVSLIDFEVSLDDLSRTEGSARVAARGEALALLRERRVSSIEASFRRDADVVYSWALGRLA